MAVDWDEVRAKKFAVDAPPPDWPADIVPVSMKGMALLGLNRRTHQLHFDGVELVTKRSLARFERVALGLGTAAAVTIALIEVGRVVMWLTQ